MKKPRSLYLHAEQAKDTFSVTYYMYVAQIVASRLRPYYLHTLHT